MNTVTIDLPREAAEFKLWHDKPNDWAGARIYHENHPLEATHIARTSITVDVKDLEHFNGLLADLIRSQIGSDVMELTAIGDPDGYEEYVTAVVHDDAMTEVIKLVNEWMHDNHLLPTICEITDIEEL